MAGDERAYPRQPALNSAFPPSKCSKAKKKGTAKAVPLG
jgi:hypothetical protein